MSTPPAAPKPSRTRLSFSPIHREVLLSALVAATLATAVLVLFPVSTVPPWYLMGVFLALGLIGELVHVRVRHGQAAEEITLLEPVLVASVVLMPPWFTLALAFVSVIAVDTVNRRAVLKLVFNAVVYVAAAAAFVLVYRTVTGTDAALAAATSGAVDLHVVAGLVLGALTFTVVNFYLLYRVLAILSGEGLWAKLWLTLPLAWGSILGAVALGATVVALYRTAPVLLPLAFLTGGVLLYGHARTTRAEKEMDRSAQLSALSLVIAGISDSGGMLGPFLDLTRRAFSADVAFVVMGTGEIIVVEDQEGVLTQRNATREESTLRPAGVPRLGAVLTSAELPEPWTHGLIVPLGVESAQTGVVVVASRKKSSAFHKQSAAVFSSLVGALVAAQNNALLSDQIQAITASQAEAVLSLDEKGRVSFANPAAEELLGTLGRTLRNAPYREVFRLEHQGVPIDLLQVGVSGSAMTHERAVLHVGSTQRTVQYTASPIRPISAGGARRTGVVLALTDVTLQVAAQEALARSQRKLLEVGKTLQKALLPPVLPELTGVEVAARYHPGAEGMEIGGDFYDVFDILEDSWMVVIGDVCGRGAEAAALTALTRHTLRAAALRESAPSRLLEVLNEAVLRHNQDGEEQFCTVAAAQLRLGDSPSLRVSCGGHPAPILIRQGVPLQEVGPPGTLLGLFPDISLGEEEVSLQSGDIVVFYTDGVSEARNAAGEQFGERMLAKVLQRTALLPAEEVARRLDAALTDFRGGPNDDDTAFVVLSFS